MTFFRNRSLLTKVNIVVAIILLAVLSIATMVNYRQQKAFVIEEAIEKARIVADQAIRGREYISSELQAGEIALSRDRYGLIPVVASTRIGMLVAQDLGYNIRQISGRFRSPENAPDSFESEMLEKFEADPQMEEEYAFTSIEGKPVFRYLKPFVAEASCLECHGEPQAAPDYIKQLFPVEKDQAYYYKIGEVIGAASVTIPMDRLNAQIAANLRNEILYAVCVFLALVVCLGFLVRMAVAQPLAQFGAVIRDIIRTGRFEKSIPSRGRDEIGILIEGFNEMTSCLREKTEHLEESEKRFRLLTETAHETIISFLSNGQVILFNREAEKMFGYSKSEILGVSVEQLIHEDCASLHKVGVEAYLDKNGSDLVCLSHEIPGRRRDGSRLDLELSLSVAESDGHLFYTAILRPVS